MKKADFSLEGEKTFIKIRIREIVVCSYHKQIYYVGGGICLINRNRIVIIRQFKTDYREEDTSYESGRWSTLIFLQSKQ